MLCSRVQNLLSAYCDSELPGDDMIRIRSHVGQCPSCAREYAAIRQVKSLLAALPAAEPRQPLTPAALRLRAEEPALRLGGVVLRPGRWTAGWRAAAGETAARIRRATPSLAAGAMVAASLVAGFLAQRPQHADAVSARVPGQIQAGESAPFESAAAALEAVSAPMPEGPAFERVFFQPRGFERAGAPLLPAPDAGPPAIYQPYLPALAPRGAVLSSFLSPRSAWPRR